MDENLEQPDEREHPQTYATYGTAEPSFAPARATSKYCCSYDHDGATWSIIIDAYDWSDAHARISKLGFLRLDGELEMTVRSGFVARAYCAVRNAFR